MREWELDFCSRPIIDERGKRVWELLICDATRGLEYAEYFPNNRINSVELGRALKRVMEERGLGTPEKIRFFRGQMQTIISRACAEIGVTPTPSRRCLALQGWLEDRNATVYPQHPGYDANAPPLVTFDEGMPQELPDALRGEQWNFVKLPLDAVVEESRLVTAGKAFGAVFDLDTANVKLPGDTVVPGVVVFSRRAAALAGWMNGLELANVSVNKDIGLLFLETGVSTRWQYATYRVNTSTTQEAKAWEAAKAAAGGVHFLAVQPDPDSDEVEGFWMLREWTPNA